jgi:uncharacterized damage-inducible protein DinB
MKRWTLAAGILALAGAGVATLTARQGTMANHPMPPSLKPLTASVVTNSVATYYRLLEGWLTKTADMVSEADYSFKPTGKPAADGQPIRSIGQILGHVADSNYSFCGIVSGTKGPAGSVEQTAKTKAALQKALAESFAYCDQAWASLTDQTAAAPADLPEGLGKSTRLGVLVFQSHHLAEHYGNLVTYLRVLGLVPPSSQPH